MFWPRGFGGFIMVDALVVAWPLSPVACGFTWTSSCYFDPIFGIAYVSNADPSLLDTSGNGSYVTGVWININLFSSLADLRKIVVSSLRVLQLSRGVNSSSR